jgi:plastocyanin
MAARLAFATLLLLSTVVLAGCSSKPAVAGDVAIHGLAYDPSTLSVPAGKSVRFTNHDSVEHSITSDSGGFDVDIDGGGNKGLVTMSTPGTYAYHCRYHPSMHGTLVFT